MNKQLLKVIQHAVQSDKNVFALNQSWEYLHQQYNIGRTQGNKFEITAEDKAELLVLVAQATGIDLSQTLIEGFAAMQREEALAVTHNEKFAGQAVKKCRLALKPLTGHALKINAQTFCLPSTGHFDIALEDLFVTDHNSLLIIENYRCFDRLQELHLKLPDPYDNPLVLYRGDNTYHEKIVRQFIDKFALPVLVMVDIDPQGLLIAQSFPYVVALIAPSLTFLETAFNDPEKTNPTLYTKQLANCHAILENSPYRLIQQLWGMMKTYQAGLVQEYWLLANCQLQVHPLLRNR